MRNFTRSQLTLTSKKRALQFISEYCSAQHAEANPKAIFQALIAREKLGSTNMGHGIAIPHACSSSSPQRSLYIVKKNDCLL